MFICRHFLAQLLSLGIYPLDCANLEFSKKSYLSPCLWLYSLFLLSYFLILHLYAFALFSLFFLLSGSDQTFLVVYALILTAHVAPLFLETAILLGLVNVADGFVLSEVVFVSLDHQGTHFLC